MYAVLPVLSIMYNASNHVQYSLRYLNFVSAVPVPQARKASLARFFEKRKER